MARGMSESSTAGMAWPRAVQHRLGLPLRSGGVLCGAKIAAAL